MTFQKIDTVANTQITVSNTAINLMEQLRLNANFDEIKNCDCVWIQVDPTVGNAIRVLTDGNTPTDTIGMYVTGNLFVSGATLDQIKMIRATASDATVNIQVGNQTVAVNQFAS